MFSSNARISNPSEVVQISAPAKVNLFLEILGKRPDGFHELETVMTTVSLADKLTFEVIDSNQIVLEILWPQDGSVALGAAKPAGQADEIPTDERNLIVRALQMLRQAAGDENLGMHVVLEKRVPAAAGLGGASSDAAAALVAGNEAWKIGLNREQLHELASNIGSDVPFFLYGGTAVCTGRGEKVQPISTVGEIEMVIAKPRVGLSTPAVFKQCSIAATPVSSNAMIEALASGEAARIGLAIENRLQVAAEKLVKEIGHLADAFSETGCVGHQMSGSGTSYFGIFRNRSEAVVGAEALKNRNLDWDVFSVHSLQS